MNWTERLEKSVDSMEEILDAIQSKGEQVEWLQNEYDGAYLRALLSVQGKLVNEREAQAKLTCEDIWLRLNPAKAQLERLKFKARALVSILDALRTLSATERDIVTK